MLLLKFKSTAIALLVTVQSILALPPNPSQWFNRRPPPSPRNHKSEAIRHQSPPHSPRGPVRNSLPESPKPPPNLFGGFSIPSANYLSGLPPSPFSTPQNVGSPPVESQNSYPSQKYYPNTAQKEYPPQNFPDSFSVPIGQEDLPQSINEISAPVLIVPSPMLENLQQTRPQAVIYAVENTDNILTSETAFPDANERGDCSKEPGWEYPCVSEKTGNKFFSSCCAQFDVPEECSPLCKYNSDQTDIKQIVVDQGNSHCLEYMSPIVHCASQNFNNTQCCDDLGFSSITNGDYCHKYCNPTSHGGIKTFGSKDLVCVANWDVVMWCHRSGLQFDDPDRKFINQKTQPWKVRRKLKL